MLSSREVWRSVGIHVLVQQYESLPSQRSRKPDWLALTRTYGNREVNCRGMLHCIIQNIKQKRMEQF
jgi:hypothetical protein